MFEQLSKNAVPIAALSLAIALSGCNDMGVDITINGEKGVPLAQLDMSGAAPDELVLSSGDKVIISQGSALEITAEGDDDAVDALRFVRDGDMIGITRDSGWNGTGSATVLVTMAAPSDITIAGSGDVETPLLAKEAEATIGGSGSIRIGAVDADRLEVTIGGSGDIEAGGKVAKLDITIGGSGSVEFADVVADDVDISIGGSGNVDLQSNGTVEASIGGSGEINVEGSADCTLSKGGSGSLNCTPGA